MNNKENMSIIDKMDAMRAEEMALFSLISDLNKVMYNEELVLKNDEKTSCFDEDLEQILEMAEKCKDALNDILVRMTGK